jgi:hypothetical protein
MTFRLPPVKAGRRGGPIGYGYSHHNELSQSFKKHGDFANRLPRRLQKV